MNHWMIYALVSTDDYLEFCILNFILYDVYFNITEAALFSLTQDLESQTPISLSGTPCENLFVFLGTQICKSYTMGCPPVRGDNPRALASGLSYVQVDNPWYNYFIPPTSV